MKKIVGVAALLVMFALPVYAQDYCIDFYPVSYSGKSIDDGYFSSSLGGSYWEVVVCGTYMGDTSDWFYADLYDSDGFYYETIYGTIVWNKSVNPTSAYIQGTTLLVGDELYTFYLDGTLKRSGIKYSLTSKAGETYTNGGAPWVIVLTSFKSSTGYVVDKDFKKDRERRVRTKGKNIWKKME
jgi:hypothetical protein